MSVGELSARKDHACVLEALHLLQFAGIRYFICGEGPLAERLILQIRKLHLEKQVVLLGYRADAAQLVQAADLFVFPSRQEGLPVALMEAIAAGTPVICSAIRGCRDLVSDKRCMFGPDDARRLAELLRESLCLEETECAGGRASRVVLKESMQDSVEKNYRRLRHFDLERVAERMRVIYDRVSLQEQGSTTGKPEDALR